MFTFRITTALTGTNIIQATDYKHALEIAKTDEYNAALYQCTQYDWNSIVVEGKYKFRISFYDVMEMWADSLEHAQAIAIDKEWTWTNLDGICADTEFAKNSIEQI